MVFDLIVSALVTVLVVTLTDGADDDSDGGCAAFVLPDLLFPYARNHPIHWEDSGKGKGDISRGF